MKNYVGRKCKGFRFESGTDGMKWHRHKEKHIGEIGEITNQFKDYVKIDFSGNFWHYPISLIEPHLILETPQIPKLGEGVEMEVSIDGINWCEMKVIAQRHDGLYITGHDNLWVWKYARPIQEVKKYTKEELVKIVGHDFEII
jgi:hypothetical protein